MEDFKDLRHFTVSDSFYENCTHSAFDCCGGSICVFFLCNHFVLQEDLIGKSIFEVVHPDDKDAVTREVLRQDRELARGYNSYAGQLDIMGILKFIFYLRLLLS